MHVTFEHLLAQCVNAVLFEMIFLFPAVVYSLQSNINRIVRVQSKKLSLPI